jgi:dipeptidyl aminopeptidase/acylaminoacyl peptidase
MEAEFGLPMWVFGYRTYDFVSAEQIACIYTQDGIWYIATLDVESGTLREIETPYTFFEYPVVVAGKMVVVAGSSRQATTVIQVDMESGEYEIIRPEEGAPVDAGYLSEPESIEFPTTDGQTAYGLYYPPQNADYAAPAGEKPPLLVQIHGGPTAATNSQLLYNLQFWTSRGIAVLDVNYGGSTGYGRDYRERLIGEWGVVDVDDAVNGALFLVEGGEADPERLAITGGSAGGYTALAAMTFRDVFKAGASHFGVSDLEALLTDIHKFDTHSLDGLVGPYPLYRRRYMERSPINYAEQLNCPVIFFQGLEDTIVPADQSEMMFEVLKGHGIPTAYIAFEGEHHGFTQAQNIKRSLEAELYFYSRVFGFELADPVEPVHIENLNENC